MKEPSSKDFPIKELRCNCSVCKGFVPNGVQIEALAALQHIRDELGLPMVVTSAFRCENHEDEVHKTTVGRHRQGLAFDIAVPWGRKRGEIIRLAIKRGFKGFGFGKTFIHIDFRDSEITTWGYS